MTRVAGVVDSRIAVVGMSASFCVSVMTPPLKQTIYHLIRDRLISGRLRPGSRVSELALSKELGTSRTPVREAISQLANDGLVEQVPNAGTFVRKPDRADLEDLYQLREWLEPDAVAEAARRITDEQLAAAGGACGEMRAVAREFRDSGQRSLGGDLLYREVVADFTLHMTLIQASGNRRVLAIVANQHVLSQVWGFLPERQTLRSLAKVYREHCRVLRCVRRGDAEGAREAMRRHIVLGREKVLARYDWERRQAAAGVEPQWFWPPALHETVHRMEQEHAGDGAAAAGLRVDGARGAKSN